MSFSKDDIVVFYDGDTWLGRVVQKVYESDNPAAEEYEVDFGIGDVKDHDLVVATEIRSATSEEISLYENDHRRLTDTDLVRLSKQA